MEYHRHMSSPRLDHEGMRRTNRRLVVDLLRTRSTVPRAEIARVLSLSKATVSDIVAELMERGIVQETGVGESNERGGRKPILLTLNTVDRFVIGIDIENRGISVGVADLAGTLRAVLRRPTVVASSVTALVDQINELVDDVLADERIARSAIMALGIGVPGTVDRGLGTIQHSYALGFDAVPLASLVMDAMHIPTVVDNCTRVMALGESWYGGTSGTGNLFFINAGYGIGSAMVIDGHLYNRHSEFGHVYVTARPVRCTCGHTGCLEAIASAAALEQQAGDLPDSSTNANTGPDTEIGLVTAARAGNDEIQRLVGTAGKYMGRAASFIANTFFPDRIVVGGVLAAAGDLLLDPFRAELLLHTRDDLAEKTEISVSDLGSDGGVRGAVALGLNEVVFR